MTHVISCYLKFNIFNNRLFLGFIPHDQEEFMNSMKQLVETHKKEQNVKQKMVRKLN